MAQASPPPRPAALILDSIGKQAEAVRTAAAAITERIVHFQSYLSSLPGRVVTECHGDHPDAESESQLQESSLILKLHRSGKEWILSQGFWHHNMREEENVDFRPLVDAPLNVKIAAVKMFPDMLAAMEKSQAKLVQEMGQTVLDYDKFAETLKAEKFRDVMVRGRSVKVESKANSNDPITKEGK